MLDSTVERKYGVDGRLVHGRFGVPSGRWEVIKPGGALMPVGLRPVLQVIFTTLLVAVLVLAGGFALLTLYKLFSGQE